MTNQEAFNIMVARLKDGTGRAMSTRTDDCAYLNGDGHKCVVGCLLTDEQARQAEDQLYSAAAVNRAFNLKLDEAMLRAVQQVHDDPSSWDGTQFVALTMLDVIAARFDLTVPS